MNYDIPMTRAWVPNSFLTGGQEEGYTPAYWYAVSLIPDRIIGCHVMLSNGANWARLPIHILAASPTPTFDPEPHQSQKFDCFSHYGQVNRYNFLRGQMAEAVNKSWQGEYLFTIDYADPHGSAPFSEDVEQHKQHHIFKGSHGRFVAVPNNLIRWIDASLYEPFDELPPYRRLTKLFSAEAPND